MDRSSLCTQVIHQVNHSLIKSSSVCTIIIFTVRNEVAKVMFLHVCVCPRGEYLGRYPPGTRCTPRTKYTPQDQVHPTGPGTPPTPWDQVPPSRDQVHYPPGPGTPLGPGTTPRDQVHHPPDQVHPPEDGYCCGRYASYWNAFLFEN